MYRVIADIKTGRDGIQFVYDTPITCHELISEILDHIIAEVGLETFQQQQFLVLYTIEFAVVLRERGCKHITVTTQEHCAATQRLCDKLEVNYTLLENLMKPKKTFDCSLGNPPFRWNHNANRHALWEDLLEKAHELTKDGGHVAMITPYVGRRKIRKVFFDNDFLLYRAQGVNSHFPGVGSTFCYHVVRKTQTGTVPDIDGVCVDVSRYGFIPNRVDPEALTIIEELTQGEPLAIQRGKVHSSKTHLFSKQKSQQFPYRYQHTSSQDLYCSVRSSDMEHSLKVICSASGYLKPWLDRDQIGVTQNSWFIPVDSEEEGHKIINFLNSDKVKMFNEISGSNTGAHDPNKYKLLRMKK